MANNSIINVVDTGNPAPTRRTVDLLPTYLRTDKNTKFLTSTIDQLIQPPVIERISGYVGSTLSPNYNPATDNYIPAANQLEGNYQLQPALVSRDTSQNIKKVIGYDDLLNQIAFEKGNVNNHDRLFKGVTYSFDPQINLDKFLNYTEYYWLPNGPDAIEITGNQIDAVSTYRLIDDPTQQLFVFNPDGITPDPLITLYRGMTYVFNVDSVHSVYFKTAISSGDQDAYLETVSNNGISSGQIIFVVDDKTPDIIYYVAGDDSTIAGEFLVKDLDQNTSLDVDNEIVGKQTYTSGNGVIFTNGMKIRFNGNVTPAYYNESEWVVDGVGVAITLTSWNSLSVGGQVLTNLDVNFDAQPFDQFPFDNFTNIPLTPEYITINRSSQDLNPWSRYNRWFHRDVIAAAAQANGTVETYPVDSRAKRPIIEFYPNLQLFNYGSVSFTAIDVIDNITTAAFKSIEGQYGYFVDGEQLEEGYRVVFNADEDSLVRGRVYRVTFVDIEGNQVISLIPTDDHIPPVGASVSVIRGADNAGCNWWFDGLKWTFSQQRTALNQPPLFDLFDENEISFSDVAYYKSTFLGTKIFGYKVGTGTPDAVLGFPLAYLNVTNVGDFLFENCFNTDTFNIVDNNNIVKVWAKNNFLKVNGELPSYVNTWVENPWINIPIIQFQIIESATNNIEITSINNPGYATDITIDVYINDKYTRVTTDYRFVSQGSQYFVFFTNALKAGDRVQFNIYTAQPPNGKGFYNLTLSATNNPLNGPISQFTLAEVTHSLKDIAVGFPIDLIGDFPGDSNLRDLGPVASYGTRLVSHGTPVSFAQFFIGNKEHSLIDAVKKVADHYQQFKLGFIKRVTELQGTYTPADAVDAVMVSLTTGKNSSFAYGYSDMVAFGADTITRTYTVTDNRITAYSLIKQFDNTVLGNRCVLIYLNGTQLVSGRDYTFDAVTPVFHLLTPFKNGDVIVVKDYGNTAGCYVPPTPTKLGMYPSYVPEIFVDNTYVTPTKVIQGHDGSITVAFGDYRDDIILELENRIYNNLKAHYNKELLDINSVIPGAFRSNDYSLYDINNILVPEFLKWAGFFGVDYQTNDAFNSLNPKTWNYANDAATDLVTGLPLPGHWRSVYKWYFDTDRPHTHPWEMLGFTEKPTWWDTQYGPYPYTRGNLLLWQDLRDGRIRQGDRAGVDTLYARPKLLDIIPVDDQGNLLTLDVVNILGNINGALLDQPWEFGDQGPAETAWRRSSLWPFAVQILLALTRPALYSAYMFDPSRIIKNKAGQYRYTVKQTLADSRATQVVAEDVQKFIDLSQLLLWGQVDINGNRILASGYSVLLIESNNQRTYGYVDQLATDLSNLDYNLFAKMGGFISKEKTRIIIDAVDPTSANPGVLLPQEDYAIYFNKSNPTNTFSASGIIVQKGTDGYVMRGYDKHRPYFRIYKPIRTNVDPVINVGGVSASYVTWTANQFYQKGQYVAYANGYYVAILAHTAGNSFGGSQYFQQIPALPSQGGVSVDGAVSFESSVTLIPYGTSFSTIQAVFDVIVGYGEWLTTQGFVFDEVQQDLNEVMDWTFSAREFLYWTTQNWQPDSIITVSPFADRVKFKMTTGVVDDLENPYYEYNLYKTDGGPFPQHNYTISRQDNYFVIQTVNTTEGIFFTQFNTVQKEHAIVLNNLSLFGDIIYQIETGYRQLRININGFRTANWTGDFFSPGFIYDNAEIKDWSQYTDYQAGDIVRYSGKYYGTNVLITGAASFNFSSWSLLPGKPVPTLYPNFDYKINQFEDFYSLDIDNFDAGQEKMAQHLTGYTPRIYLDNIFNDPIAQYKFYQGYIKEKGTRNAIDKLAKASTHNLQGKITYNETWALRVGTFGGINTKRELEVKLSDSKFFENPQLIKFVDNVPTVANDLTYYKSVYDLLLKPDDYNPDAVFATTSATYNSNSIKLPTAGFVHYNDIKATVYNKNSILDIANPSQLFEGDVLWLGFREDGEWDALRYTQIDAKAISAELLTGNPNQFSFATDIQHNLAIGDLVSVTRFNTGLDAIYIVVGVPDPFTFLVNTTLTSIPANAETQVGLLFKFVSARLNTFNDIRYNPTLEHAPAGAKVWVNNQGGKWAVLEKVDNFTSTLLNGGVPQSSASYGAYICATPDNTALIVSSPGYVNSSLGQGVNVDVGRVYYYSQGLVRNANNEIVTELASINSWELNDSGTIYSDSAIPANFGATVLYEPNDGLFITSAPNASNIKLTINTSQHVAHGVGNISGNGQDYCGLVKITNINTITNFQQTLQVIGSTNAGADGMFGHAMAVQQKSGSKILLVGAPGEVAGRVYQYTLSDVTATNVNITATNVSSLYITTSTSNAQFGYAISKFGVTSDAASVSYVAIGAPGAGTVSIYTLTNTTLHLTQLISASTIGLDNSYGLGKKVVMSSDAKFLFTSLPDYQSGNTKGAVIVSTLTNTGYVVNQIIQSPSQISGLIFGYDFNVSADNNTLVISAFGNAFTRNTSFDKYSTRLDATSTTPYTLDPTSSQRTNIPSWDSGATTFVSVTTSSGSAYVYNQYDSYFAYGQQIESTQLLTGSGFGNNVAITSNQIIIGAPTSKIDDIATGQVVVFTGKDNTTGVWKTIRTENDLVDLDKINRIVTINNFSEEILDYIEFIDPIKGNIPGQADQELRFKSLFDPAVYSIGVTGVVVDTNINWIDEHVGELWWDLSAVKYMWYEQGDAEYRRNNWGGVFPGSTFDVYEWVGSEYLPSQWSAIADTAEGLAQGISGQPKYADNSVMSVKQVYNAVSSSFTNIYYFWVKNKTVVPSTTSRRMSAFEVASLISNPQAQGLQYAMVVSPNALALVNYKTSLVSDNIHLSIEMDTSSNPTKIHTEWLLVEEGNPESMPNAMLEQKLIDSILGHDVLGNPVPDPSLPSRLQFGIGIRPRQSMFVNRYEAIRNIFEYANTILEKTLIRGLRSFDNLNASEEIPASNLGLYDTTVPDVATLDFIVTKFYVQAVVDLVLNSNGNIESVNILNSGYGYNADNAPYLTITGNGSGAIIRTIINSQGQISGFDIINSGTGYTTASADIRPYSVIVESDKNSNGNWAMYQWNGPRQVWDKVKTQTYSTPYYWDSINWYAPSYNALQPTVTTVDSTYELDILKTLPEGNYVKVRNGGDGRYLILRKTAANNLVGTFDADWDLMVSENGTIQINNRLWNTTNSVYAFDEISSFDQTEFDQTPDTELFYIIEALRKDIFISDLKVYWNTLFFKAVKYAFSEQKNLDWVFKTAFISVTNHAGQLDQRPTYKLQDSSYYESYVKEVKPYHTKIRNFTVNYTATDYSNTLVTDFDLPSYWDQNQQRFRTVGFGNGELLVAPWNNWFTNYTYGVGSIIITSGGSGYQFAPAVQIIPAPGDLGTGATADAYISNGKVYKIIVTNPGQGYASTPTVIITGGGGPNVVVATAYPQLANNKIRSTTVTMKFDRVGFGREIGSKYFTDNYTGDGSDYRFPLTWVPTRDKGLITLTINGILQLSDSYNIVLSESPFATNTGTSYSMIGVTGRSTTYTQEDTTYKKQFAVLELTSVPAIQSKIEITYPKDISLFTAVDRIQDYYEPLSGMPGANQLGQLMDGYEYPAVKVDTLPYGFSGGYGVLPYWTTAWDNYSPSENYGVVLNPQNITNNDVTLLTVELQSANAENTSLDGQIAYLTNTLGSVPEFISTPTPFGIQQVPNPFYFSLISQLQAVQSQLSSVTGQISQLTISLNQLTNGNVAVTTPFIVSTGTTINTYLNGVRVDSIETGAVTLPIHGTGTAATVYIPHELFLPATTVTNFVSKVINGTSYEVTLGIFAQESVPVLGNWVMAGNTNILYNGTYVATTASTSTITLSYSSDPGTFGGGLTTISTSNNIVVFRSATDDGTLTPTDEESLDTLISGGNFDQGVILGIGASEIVVDGDTYLSANASHAPEEMIPGEIQESVSISVFSVNPMTSSTQFLSAPVIKNYKYQLDGQTQSFNMGTIANTSSLIVVAGNKPLHFGVDYVLDITNNNLGLLQPLEGPDYLSISSFDVGGINVLDKQVVFSAARTINVLSTIAYDDIGSVYVTVNGIPVPKFTGTGNQTYGYTLSKAVGRENEINPRGYLNIVKPGVIDGINNAALNKTQVWYFDAPYKANGEIYTQVIPRAIGTQFDLEQPPGVAGPYSSQVIVELNGRRLIPPSTIYYIVGDNLSAFQLTGTGKISQFNTATSTSTVITYPADNTNAYPPGSTIEWQIIDAQGFGLNQDIAYNRGQIDNNSFEVWLNGVKLDQTPLNYFLNSAQGIVQFPAGRLQKGDALAFVIFDKYEYQITNDKLLLQDLSYRGNNDTIRITSFTNHNGDFIRKEKFYGSSQYTYVIQRPVFDTAYIWVEYNQTSLIADIDYTVANDGKTITVRPSYYTGPTDTVVITSMSQNAYIGSMTYRMFTDILGRTSVKRIGDNSTTALVNPLLITDTTILVEDGGVLSTPNPAKNLPGIIYVAGERIEYFAKFGNVLSQITRGTLGTGARSGYPAGTKVIDQGPGVNVPVSEKTITQTFVSTNTNTSFVLNPADTSADKIIAFNSLANPWDQVDVFYGGRRLLKPTTNTVVTFNPIAYDSNQQDSNGNLSSVVVSPEFTITNSLTTPTVQLNIDVQPGLELVVRQKVGQSMFKLSEFADPAHASQLVLRPGQEFIESVRGFLSQDTAQLPDDNYFGGDAVIILETDAVLQDEDGSPIEGN